MHVRSLSQRLNVNPTQPSQDSDSGRSDPKSECPKLDHNAPVTIVT